MDQGLFMSKYCYEMHYHNVISQHLDDEAKKEVAERISQLSLTRPLWLDKDIDYVDQFPEIKPYINVSLSGLYLCAIMKAILEDLQGVKS